MLAYVLFRFNFFKKINVLPEFQNLICICFFNVVPDLFSLSLKPDVFSFFACLLRILRFNVFLPHC